MMKRSVTLSLLVCVGIFVGMAAISPAMAHCGKCGVSDAPKKADRKCPLCDKTGAEMSAECAAKCAAAMKKKDQACPTCPINAGQMNPQQWKAKCAAMKKKFHAHMHMWRAIREAVCVLHATAGNSAKGVVRFIKNDDRTVTVIADIEGLSPNGTHAIHIHQFGDCSSPDGKSAGGHYNPQGHSHALPDTDQRHAGDLGNLVADADGKAHYEIVVSNICIVGHRNPILGRGVIVHAKADDGGQPTGNAGSRIACGVIGIANSPANKKAPTTQPSK